MPVAAPSSDADLDVGDAYEIQMHVAQVLDLGARRGWKLGLTSRSASGGPMCGVVYEAMLVSPGGTIHRDQLIVPRVEVEIGVVFDVDVPPEADREVVAALPFRAAAALEIIDDRTTAPSVVVDWIADLATMARVIVGEYTVPEEDLTSRSGALLCDGREVGSGVCGEKIGDPLAHVSWLAGFLAARNDRIRAGEFVITGSLTGQHEVVGNNTYLGRVDGLGEVGVSFA